MTIPLAPILGVSAGLIEPIQLAAAGRPYDAFRNACINYTGYNPQVKAWDFNSLKYGLYPLIAGMLVHKVAGMAGINRALGAAKVPLVRI